MPADSWLNVDFGAMANPQDLKLFKDHSLDGWSLRLSSPSDDLKTSLDLSAANLENFDFREACLYEADLTEANLRGAQMREVDLDKANLSEANLIEANLGLASLSEADLSRACLMDAILVEADLDRAELTEAHFNGANCGSTNFSYSELTHCNFAGADLTGASFACANLIGADLESANLTDADLTRANLTGACLHGAILNRTRLVDTVLAECDFAATFLGDVDLGSSHGLSTCKHTTCSSIDRKTLEQSGLLPKAFMRGIGLPEPWIRYLRRLPPTQANTEGTVKPLILPRIISSGQTGAARAALDWSSANGPGKKCAPNWCPAGFLAEDGTIPAATDYRLSATPKPHFDQAQEWNVRETNGTVIFTVSDVKSAELHQVEAYARKHFRPCLHLKLKDGIEDAAKELQAFIEANSVQTLYVTGSRRSQEQTIWKLTYITLDKAFFAHSLLSISDHWHQ
jgi:uncharacterized protein YjbI with pentapeptide repeats